MEKFPKTPKIMHLTADWQDWIHLNTQRGCSPDSMIHEMLKQNFEPKFAREVVYKSLSRNSEPAPITIDKNYHYEKPRIQQAGNVIKTPDRDVKVNFRITRPVVALFENVLAPEECDELIRLSNIKLRRSTTVDPLTGDEIVIKDRNSYGAFFNLQENEFIAKLDRRVSSLMNWPIENGEGLQVLNYKIAGEYKPHFDFFPSHEPGSQPHLAKGGQRVSTLIMYLNEVEEAGETIFPDIGLSVVPKKGSAVYFEYCNSLGQTDALTLHGGVPVVAGEKWIATKWMRQRAYG